MNNSRSVKWIRTLFLALALVLAVSGFGILSSARAGATHAWAASSYATATIVKHTATATSVRNYKMNGDNKIYEGDEGFESTEGDVYFEVENWSDVVSTKTDKIVPDGNYALLQMPAINKFTFKMNGTKKVYEGTTGYDELAGEPQTEYQLTFESVEFVLGTDSKRITTLTQSATLNGERLSIGNKQQFPATSTIPYHEQWVQNFYGIAENGAIKADNSVDETSITSAKGFLNNYVTTYSTTDGKVQTYDALNGTYVISYDYVPENQTRIHEEFTFFMLTSDVYNVNEKINIEHATKDESETSTASSYNRKYIYQFDQKDDQTTSLLYPTFSYNPENFVISYNLTQYNYVQTTNLSFAKQIDGTTTIATLNIVSTFNTNNETEKTTYKIETTNNVSTRFKSINDGEFVEITETDDVFTLSDTNYQVKLTLETPGLYEFHKNINLKTGATTYRTLTINQVSSSVQTETFADEALWIYGYNATYASEGVEQKVLYNKNFDSKKYISDFSFLLSDNTNVNLNDVANFETDITNFLATHPTVIMATTNQAPVIFSSNFYLPNYNSKVSGYAYNATKNDYLKVNKTTRFTEVGKYYVLMQCDVANSNNSSNTACQLFAFEITSSPVKPTIHTTTDTTDEYYNNSNVTINVNQYTNKKVFLSWIANGPFEHSVKVEYYHNSNYETTEGTYQTLTNLKTVGNTTYSPLFTQDGYYKFKITSNKNSVGYYSFFIDTQPISGIAAYGIKTETPEPSTTTTTYKKGDIILTKIGGVDNSVYLTNSSFVWDWSNKDSKAKINAVRYWAPFTSIADYKNELLDSLDAITTGYQIGNFNSEISYKKVSGNLSQSQILKNAGIYVLVLTDEAGNTATFITILDNSAPTVYIAETDDSAQEITDNTINTSVNIYWDEYKAIKVSGEDLFNEGNAINLVAQQSLFGTNNETKYLLIPNERLVINGDGISESDEKILTTPKTPVSADMNPTAKTVTLTHGEWSVVLSLFENEQAKDRMISFTLYDKIENSSKRTLNFSFDQSGLKMYTFSSDAISNNSADLRWVPDNFATNREIATIRWHLPENPNIELEYITVEYFPLVDDLSVNSDSASYPYASESTFQFVLLGTGFDSPYIAVGNTSYSSATGMMEFISNAFNTSIVDNINLTNPGKYVVTRKYTDGSESFVNAAGDSLERTYIFFVDRKDVINQQYAKYQVSYGFESSFYPDDYKNDYGKTSTNIEATSDYGFGIVDSSNLKADISGNRLNISVDTPENYFGYKYTPTIITQEELATLINNFEKNYSNSLKTVIIVQTPSSTRFFRFNAPTVTSQQEYVYEDTSALTYAFSTPGIYRICVFDLANSNSILTSNPKTDLDMFADEQRTFAPNYKTFCFEITDNAPSGEFKSTSNVQSNLNTISTYSDSESGTEKVFNTNDDYVVFTFNATNTTNNAKIAYKDVLITKTETKFDKQQSKVTDKQVVIAMDGTNIREYNSSYLLTTTEPTIYKNSTEEKYYLVLPTISSNTQFNAQTDCLYKITLRYISTTNKNEYAGQTWSKSNHYLYVDHTGPYKNLFKLLETDSYLSEIESLYPGTIDRIKNKVDDNDFEFLNHYVFTVTEDFYLFFDNNNDTERAFAREYATNTYSGTTQTEITSKDYYPDNVKPLKYYDDQNKGIDNSSLNLDALDGNEKPVYRVLEAGKYYDIIERDNASNYRVFTIYVTGKDSSEEKTFADDSNLSETEFATTNLFVSLNLLETTFENGQEVTTSAKNYFGLNSEDEAKVQNTKTLNNLRYATSTFQDIATNASYSKTSTSSTNSEEEGEETQPTLTASIMNNDSLYWLILRYKLTTNTGIQQRTILYFPSADINSGRETSNHIPDLKTMLALGNNAAVEFVTSKQDLLDTLNSLIIDAKNQTQNNTGAKFELEFLNKLNGNPYYAVTNELKADNSIATVNIDGVEKAKLITKDLTISAKFDLNINIAGLELVNGVDDFIESTNARTFILKIPASNISAQIEQIYLNSTDAPLIANGELVSNTFSMNQSYRFTFKDNFGRTRTYTFPIDSEYLQQLSFDAGSSLNNYNNSTFTFTCGDSKFVYDSNHLGCLIVTITDIANNKTYVYNKMEDNTITNPLNTSEEEDATDDSETQNETPDSGDQPEKETTAKDFFETIVGSDGTTTLSFIAKRNTFIKVDIEVGSASDNLTKHTFMVYTIFPNVTITDVNGGNMIPENENEQLVTSKDLLVGLVPNNQALYNPHVYLSNGSYSTEILSDYETLISENGVYTITFKNDIGNFPLGTIKFTRKTYDISIYGVYYNDNNNYASLVKRSQGYKFDFSKLEPATDSQSGEGESSEEPQQATSNYRLIDRYFFLSLSENDWNNIVILLNENKQLELERGSVGNVNYIYEDTATRTRIYHIKGTGAYKIDTYFAITRIPTATTELVPDFRINGNKYLTQLYPTTVESSEELSATLTWTSTYTYGEETIKDFYVLELWLNGTYVGAYTNGNLKLVDSGTYTIKIHDILGQNKIFVGGTDTYTITIYRDVVFSVNDNNPIQNATFNNEVKISISNINQYNTSTFEFKVNRNSSEIDVDLVNGEYTFTQPGVYLINMSGLLKGMGDKVDKLYNTYRFTIISANEARTNYEFAKRSGYSITKLVKNGEELEGITPLYNLSLDSKSEDQFGKGRYDITVMVKGEGLIPTMEYTYTIWINDEEAILNTTRDWGTSSIAPFTIKLNPSVVYTRIGNCYVTVNGQTVLTINEENKDQNAEISQTFTKPGVYVVQMYSESGNLLSSQRITINEPLNTVAIVLIVLAAVVVFALILMFVLIRKRQKVK